MEEKRNFIDSGARKSTNVLNVYYYKMSIINMTVNSRLQSCYYCLLK